MSKKDEKEEVNVQAVAKTLGKALEQIIQNAQNPDLATQPFKIQPKEQFVSLVSRPKSKVDANKPLKSFKTGTFIDNLFLGEDDKPLGGIPIVGQMGIVGLPDVGKSILAQEVALKCASEGKKVVFVTSEDAWELPNARKDLQSRMKQKSDILGLDWETIQHNLFVFDTVTKGDLREWDIFVENYRYIVEILKGVDLLVIDSITLMDTYRGALKNRLMQLARYNQKWGITAIYVNQRAIEEPDKYAMAGGIGLAHNLDITLCIDVKKASGQLKADVNQTRPKDRQIKQWDLVHFTRMFGCRLCGFNRKYFEVRITSNGFLEMVEGEQQ